MCAHTATQHQNIIEHLNAEVVLSTITDVSVAIHWLKSTFLYVRLRRNPNYYHIPAHLPEAQLEEQLKRTTARKFIPFS